jgi:hypothetical protein
MLFLPGRVPTMEFPQSTLLGPDQFPLAESEKDRIKKLASNARTLSVGSCKSKVDSYTEVAGISVLVRLGEARLTRAWKSAALAACRFALISFCLASFCTFFVMGLDEFEVCAENVRR